MDGFSRGPLMDLSLRISNIIYVNIRYTLRSVCRLVGGRGGRQNCDRKRIPLSPAYAVGVRKYLTRLVTAVVKTGSTSDIE